jgi:hypothetical protein
MRPSVAETARAEAAQVNAAAISTFVTAGFTPESAILAVNAGDLSQLKHTGLVSVQMQAPGSQAMPAPARSAPELERGATVNITNQIPPAPVAEPAVVNLTVNERESASSQPIVNVAAPAVTVEVNPTPVKVDVAAPNVSVTNDVQPSAVAVENFVAVTTPPRKVTTEVQRDPRGLITKTTATERDV